MSYYKGEATQTQGEWNTALAQEVYSWQGLDQNLYIMETLPSILLTKANIGEKKVTIIIYSNSFYLSQVFQSPETFSVLIANEVKL